MSACLEFSDTLLGTGLRISELAALKVSDLEISERRVGFMSEFATGRW